MSPARFNGNDIHENSRGEINGVRPSPLKTQKGSHVIHKPSSSTSISSVPRQQQQQKQHRPPVIIYTQSPKIIHTHAKDFRALVQKLTGLSSPACSNNNHETDTAAQELLDRQPHKSSGERPALSSDGKHNLNVKPLSNEDNDSSSVLTDENSSGGDDLKAFLSSIAVNESQSHPHFADIPLFTLNDTNFSASTLPVYRNMSPAVFKFM